MRITTRPLGKFQVMLVASEVHVIYVSQYAAPCLTTGCLYESKCVYRGEGEVKEVNLAFWRHLHGCRCVGLWESERDREGKRKALQFYEHKDAGVILLGSGLASPIRGNSMYSRTLINAKEQPVYGDQEHLLSPLIYCAPSFQIPTRMQIKTMVYYLIKFHSVVLDFLVIITRLKIKSSSNTKNYVWVLCRC